MAAASRPPACAIRGRPPPPPPARAAATRTSSSARSPRETAASVAAATKMGRPPASAASATKPTSPEATAYGLGQGAQRLLRLRLHPRDDEVRAVSLLRLGGEPRGDLGALAARPLPGPPPLLGELLLERRDPRPELLRSRAEVLDEFRDDVDALLEIALGLGAGQRLDAPQPGADARVRSRSRSCRCGRSRGGASAPQSSLLQQPCSCRALCTCGSQYSTTRTSVA